MWPSAAKRLPGLFQKLPSTEYCTMIGMIHNWLVAILTGIYFIGGGELCALQTFPIFDVFVAWAFIKNFTFTVWNLPRCLEIYHKKVKNEKCINILVRKKTETRHDLYLLSNYFFHSSILSTPSLTLSSLLWFFYSLKMLQLDFMVAQ